MVVYVVNISYKNPFLQSFLGVNQLYTTCGSREFCHYKAPRNRKLYLYGISGCIERPTNFLRPTVREIWILCNFETLGPNFGQENGFRSPFGLIIKSILKIDPLRIPKQLVYLRLQ